MAEYSKRDIVQLDKVGGHYSRHVSAMTEEGLHGKSDIAAELAWRDAELARLREALELIGDQAGDLREAAEQELLRLFGVFGGSGVTTGRCEGVLDAIDRIVGKRAREALGK